MWLSFLFNFIISCHLLIPSLLTQLFHCLSPTETLPPLLVAEGWGESRKPNQGNRYDRCNPRYQISQQLSSTSPWMHRAGTLQGIFAGASRGDAKNLPPIKLSTRFPNKAICVGKHMHYSSFRRDSDGGTSPSLARSETVARGWEAGTKERPVFTICSA